VRSFSTAHKHRTFTATVKSTGCQPNQERYTRCRNRGLFICQNNSEKFHYFQCCNKS